jgi:hypothetical protein
MNSAIAMNRRTWGRSEVSGTERFVKNAPEMVYGHPKLSVEENANWMRPQLIEVVGEGVDLENVILRTNTKLTQKDGRPVYVVGEITPQGMITHTEAMVFDIEQAPQFKESQNDVATMLQTADRETLLANLEAARRKNKDRWRPVSLSPVSPEERAFRAGTQ